MEIRLRRKEHELTLRSDRMYGTPMASAYIKAHSYPDEDDLSPEYKEKWDALVGEDDDMKYRLHAWAFESVQEYWWDWAKEEAESRGFGKVFSTGRQGGYLILPDWNEEKLNGYLNDIYEACANCQEHFDAHFRGKCLYQPARFYPKDKDALSTLVSLLRYIRMLELSLKTWVPLQYKDELENQIQWAWDTRKEKPEDGLDEGTEDAVVVGG